MQVLHNGSQVAFELSQWHMLPRPAGGKRWQGTTKDRFRHSGLLLLRPRVRRCAVHQYLFGWNSLFGAARHTYEPRSGRAASLAPKNTVARRGGGAAALGCGNTASSSCSAQREL
jgi:hypothetical protein